MKSGDLLTMTCSEGLHCNQIEILTTPNLACFHNTGFPSTRGRRVMNLRSEDMGSSLNSTTHQFGDRSEQHTTAPPTGTSHLLFLHLKYFPSRYTLASLFQLLQTLNRCHSSVMPSSATLFKTAHSSTTLREPPVLSPPPD